MRIYDEHDSVLRGAAEVYGQAFAAGFKSRSEQDSQTLARNAVIDFLKLIQEDIEDIN